MEKFPCVYIVAKAYHSTLYTGVTSDHSGRVWQHREVLVRGFTQRYGIKRLVWFERHETMESADREASPIDVTGFTPVTALPHESPSYQQDIATPPLAPSLGRLHI
jgi:predicted GIY-YIG superfamily endonuclease